jgi:hypothetical protein
MGRFDAHGTELQLRVFKADEPMDTKLMVAAADRVRAHLAADPHATSGDTD